MTDDRRYDTIVVGVGAMGSAAAYHLARRGDDVLGVERYDVPHSMGSSHGVTRIIRKAYHEHPGYIPLLERAYELWRDLEADHPTDLLHVTGSITAGPADSEEVEGALEACRRHDVEHETLTGTELGERFPGYDVPADYRAVFQPDGGFLHAEQCIVAHVEAAHRHGAEIRARERVLDWEATGGDVRVETDRATYRADRLVITAGTWADDLVPELDGIAVPERQVMGWFQPVRPDRFTPGTFPVWIVDCPEGLFYGFPRYRVPGFKVGKHHHLGETVDPDRMDREPRRDDERILREFTRQYFPDAAGPTVRLSTCVYANTPDRHFVVDRHPEHPEVVVGAGFSGHGFKMSSVIGELLADLALDGESDHPTDLFRVDRF